MGIFKKKRQIVTLKFQRPMITTGSREEIMSYIVDEDDEQISNPIMEIMSHDDIKKLFPDDEYKTYWTAIYRPGKKVIIQEPTRKDEWV